MTQPIDLLATYMRVTVAANLIPALKKVILPEEAAVAAGLISAWNLTETGEAAQGGD